MVKVEGLSKNLTILAFEGFKEGMRGLGLMYARSRLTCKLMCQFLGQEINGDFL